VPAVGQLVNHVVQPAPRPSVSQPLALNFPEGHADVPVAQLLQVLVPAPVHVPVEHTQLNLSAEDEEPLGHVPVHSDTVSPRALIAVAWNAPGAHSVQAMSAVELPGVE
jgi:hypothetical protein